MSYLKEKSNFNIDAAELLQNKSLFAPSVHCSYYSCLQLMKVAINEFMGIPFEELENQTGSMNTDTHNYIIKMIGDSIRNYSKEEHSIFGRNIKVLKQFRINSDYKNIQITTSESFKAIRIAKEIRSQLQETFHV